MPNEVVFIVLFMVAISVAIASRPLRIPYSVGLVVAGLVLGMLNLFEAPRLTKDLLFSVFLPGLLFEASFHVDFRSFWRNRIAISALAVPGVVFAIAATTLILTPVASALPGLEGFGWRQALVFGALISATDPIAVVAVLRSLGVPRRLSVLLEGESLLNDGTAIVFFTLAISIATAGTVSPGGLALDFGLIVGAGVLVGVVVGTVASLLIRQVDDAMVEITITTVAAYGSFLAAEQLHYSGVIATVTAGMICGNWAARRGMTPSTRIAAETFWEYVAFALNSFVFLLIGFEVDLGKLLGAWQAVIAAFAAVVLSRGFVITAVSAALRRTRERIPVRWSAVLGWGGLRGGLPMVLVLSLPRSFPHRDTLVAATFGVVLLSIIVQGLTMSPLLRWLGIAREREERSDYEVARGELEAARAALRELDRLSGSGQVGEDSRRSLQDEYETRVQEARDRIDHLRLDAELVREEEVDRLRRRLLTIEKERAVRAFRGGLIGRDAHDRLRADIDARLLELESGRAGAEAHERPSGDGGEEDGEGKGEGEGEAARDDLTPAPSPGPARGSRRRSAPR